MTAPWLDDGDVRLYHGDVCEVLAGLPDGSVDCVVTSPPYLDARPEYQSPSLPVFEDVFRELARLVAGPLLLNVGRIWRDGNEVLWWNSLLERAASAGWSLLDTLIWIKPNANPLHGRFFADSHEYVFVLGDAGTDLNTDEVRTPYAPSSIARLARGWTNHIGVKNVHSDRQRSQDELHPNGARPRSFIAIATGRDKGNTHPAPMALELAEYLVRAACQPGDVILDPFVGSGTTCLAARNFGRHSIGIDLSEQYLELAARRLQQLSLLTVPPKEGFLAAPPAEVASDQ